MEPFYRSGTLDLPSMQRLAEHVARHTDKGDCITLKGELGAGKTAFSSAFINALSVAPQEVTSPTFTISQSYPVKLRDGKDETVWHLDLYRLEEPSEAQALGLSELEEHIMLIEWPEIIESLLPPLRLELHIGFAPEQGRTITLCGGKIWQERLGMENYA